MLLEDILLAVAAGVVLLFVGAPFARFLRGAPWRSKDPLAEAQERLKRAKLEAEVARVNREADRIYEGLYEETLADRADQATKKGPRVVEEEPGAPSSGDVGEKGKRHGEG
jgi:hypothetical protein